MESVLAQLIGGTLFAWLLVFTRVGAAFMTMPGVGESFVSTRVRLLLALLVSALLAPVLGPQLPAQPEQAGALMALLAGEAFYGFFLGVLARLVLATVEFAGMIIAMQLSLANASVFNPAMAAQSSLVSALLGVMAITLFFAADLHHLMLLAVADSYTVFQPGAIPLYGDFARTFAQVLTDSFAVATQLAAPFIVLGLLFYLGLGLLARLMPQLQIFFIAIPLQIYVGLMLLGLTLSTLMLVWLNYAQTTLQGFLDIH